MTIKKKYSFETKEIAEAKIKSIVIDANDTETEFVLKTTMTLNGHTVVYLGRLEKEAAILDESGEVITEAILYDDYAVDVAWMHKDVEVQPYESWVEFEVEPTNSKHNFS